VGSFELSYATVRPVLPAPPDLGDAHLWVLLAASPGVILATGDRLLLKKAPGGVAVVCPRAFVEDTVEAA
jgi:hypothetical protein